MSKMTSSHDSAEAIGAYRDALLLDTSPQTLRELREEIDPELVEWLDLFRAAQREPVHLDPVFAARLDRAIADAPGPAPDALQPAQPLRVARSHAVSISRAPAAALTPAPERPRQTPRHVLSALATFTIVASLLIAVLYVVGPMRPQAPVQTIVATDGPVHLEPIWNVTGGDLPIRFGYGVGIDPHGNVWVADSGDRFHIISPDGASHEVWSGSRNGDGQTILHTANRGYGDVAFAPDGTIYVADTGNARIQVFAPDRSYLTEWGSNGTGDGQFLRPNGIAVAPDGSIYVSDEVRDDVQRFDRDGQFLQKFGGTGMGDGQFFVLAGVGVAPSGDVYVADYSNTRIQRFSADGDFVSTWGKSGSGEGQLDNPNDVAIDGAGRVYVAELNNRIQVFTPDGKFLTTGGAHGSGLGEFNDLMGIAVSPEGVAYVSDRDSLQAFRLVPGEAPATATP